MKSGATPKCYLYRHFDAEGTLLYVGISLSAVARLAQHRWGSEWFPDIVRVEIEAFESREASAEAEKVAIVNERPVWNKVHALRDRAGLDHDGDGAGVLQGGECCPTCGRPVPMTATERQRRARARRAKA